MTTDTKPAWLEYVAKNFDLGFDPWNHIVNWSKVALAEYALRNEKTFFHGRVEGFFDEKDYQSL